MNSQIRCPDNAVRLMRTLILIVIMIIMVLLVGCSNHRKDDGITHAGGYANLERIPHMGWWDVHHAHEECRDVRTGFAE